jgi:hypothetical protein
MHKEKGDCEPVSFSLSLRRSKALATRTIRIRMRALQDDGYSSGGGRRGKDMQPHAIHSPLGDIAHSVSPSSKCEVMRFACSRSILLASPFNRLEANHLLYSTLQVLTIAERLKVEGVLFECCFFRGIRDACFYGSIEKRKMERARRPRSSDGILHFFWPQFPRHSQVAGQAQFSQAVVEHLPVACQASRQAR